MSPKILRKDELTSAGISSLDLKQFGAAPGDNRGLKKLVLPDASSIPDVSFGNWEGNTESHSPLDAQDEARRKAAGLIAEAEERAKMIEAASREKSQKEFEEKVEAEVAIRTEELRDNFSSTIERLGGLSEEISKRVESDLVTLALAIAKKLIGREISVDREIVVTLLNRALEKLNDRALAEVHVNPEDLKYIEANRESILFRGTLDLKSDPSISIGGCLIHTNKGDIDARIESQFEELSHGLIDV